MTSPPPKLHQALSWAIAAAILLIAWGGLTTNTASGMACGDDWPLCRGKFFPDWSQQDQFIEWVHRGLAALMGLFVAGIAVCAWPARRLRRPALISLGLLLAQAFLGMATVKMENASLAVNVLHLGTAVLFLGSLVVFRERTLPSSASSPAEGLASLAPLARIAAGAIFVQILLGALALHSKIPAEGALHLQRAFRDGHVALGLVSVVLVMVLAARLRERGAEPRVLAPARCMAALAGIQFILGALLFVGASPASLVPTLVLHIAVAAGLMASAFLLLQRLPGVSTPSKGRLVQGADSGTHLEK